MLLAGVSIIVSMFAILSISPFQQQRGLPIAVVNLSPDQLHSLYESEVAFNVTGEWNITLTNSPGTTSQGSFSVEAFKECLISIVYSPVKFVDGLNQTTMPGGSNVSISILGQTNGFLRLPAGIALPIVNGSEYRVVYDISIPQNAIPGHYSFQLILIPKGTSYLARFVDVSLNVN